ncbi:MAG: gliding motility-associated C-terminal domain-containing protein [Bacteroidota bacterium]
MRPLVTLILFIFTVAGSLPAQDFPPETVVCRQGAFTLENPLMSTAGLFFQWERSFDGGSSWSDVPGGTDADLTINNPNTGIFYRVRYADSEVCLMDPTCGSLTHETRLVVDIAEFFQTATICQGEGVTVGTDTYTTGGNYQTVLDMGGCDSIVNTFVLAYESYDQLIFADLCPDEIYLGRSFERDTVFSETFTSINGCDSTITYEITLSFPDDLEIEGPDEICAGETATLFASGQFSSYSWDGGSSQRQIAVDQPGTYELTVTNSQGCTAELTHEIRVVELEATADFSPPSCPETATASLNLTAIGDDFLMYSFDGGESFVVEPQQENLMAGTYNWIVESPGGCQLSGETSIPEAPGLNLSTPLPLQQNIERGDSVPLLIETDFEVSSLSWTPSMGLSCDDCPDPVARPLVDGSYLVKATAPGGCEETLAFTFSVRDNRRFFAPTAFSPNGDGQNETWAILPGPRTERIADLMIFDRWGGTLFVRRGGFAPNDPEIVWDGTSAGSPLEVGTYAYAATLEFSDGTSRQISGTINLIR